MKKLIIILLICLPVAGFGQTSKRLKTDTISARLSPADTVRVISPVVSTQPVKAPLYREGSDTLATKAYARFLITLISETDPIFSASVAFNIKASDTTRWAEGGFPYTQTLTSNVVWDGNVDFRLGFSTSPAHILLISDYESSLISKLGYVILQSVGGTFGLYGNSTVYSQSTAVSGIQYAFNYASQFADRSLIDKNYADSINRDCPDLIMRYWTNGDTLTEPVITCANQVISLQAKTHNPYAIYQWSSNVILSDPLDSIVDVFESGVYIVTVTNTHTGCQVVDSIRVGLDNDDPAGFAFVSGIVDTIPVYVTGQVCITNPKANHIYFYNWTGGLADANPTKITSSGIYTCNVSDLNNGCGQSFNLAVKPSFFNPIVQAAADTTNSIPLRKGNIFVDNSGNIYISKNTSRGGWVKLNYIIPFALLISRKRKRPNGKHYIS